MSTKPPRAPSFEPITDLDDYAFVFAQKGDDGWPVLWVHPRVNPYAVAQALRIIADQVELASDEDGGYSEAERARGMGYDGTPEHARQEVPSVLRGRGKQ